MVSFDAFFDRGTNWGGKATTLSRRRWRNGNGTGFVSLRGALGTMPVLIGVGSNEMGKRY